MTKKRKWGIALIVLGSFAVLGGSYMGGIFVIAIGSVLFAQGKKDNTAAASAPAPSVDTPPAPTGASDISHHYYPGGVSKALTGKERIEPSEWVILDTETTGLHPREDRIIEFSAMHVRDGSIVDTYTTLINPGCDLSPTITRITGLKTSDVRYQPHFGQVCQKIAAFIGTKPVVAHNAKFDIDFLTAEFARAGITWACRYIDTVDLARNAFPGMENYKLNTLIRELGLLDHSQDHRAESDVLATSKLYMMCREKLVKAQVISGLHNVRQSQEQHGKPEVTKTEQNITRNVNEKAVKLNDLGREYEAEGQIDKAILYYGQAIAEGIDIIHPYKRLAVLHRKRHEYADEIRACTAAIEMLEKQLPASQNSIIEFKHRITAAQEKLQRSASAVD